MPMDKRGQGRPSFKRESTPWGSFRGVLTISVIKETPVNRNLSTINIPSAPSQELWLSDQSCKDHLGLPAVQSPLSTWQVVIRSFRGSRIPAK